MPDNFEHRNHFGKKWAIKYEKIDKNSNFHFLKYVNYSTIVFSAS